MVLSHFRYLYLSHSFPLSESNKKHLKTWANVWRLYVVFFITLPVGIMFAE